MGWKRSATHNWLNTDKKRFFFNSGGSRVGTVTGLPPPWPSARYWLEWESFFLALFLLSSFRSHLPPLTFILHPKTYQETTINSLSLSLFYASKLFFFFFVFSWGSCFRVVVSFPLFIKKMGIGEEKPVSEDSHEAAAAATENVTVSPVYKVRALCFLVFCLYTFCSNPCMEKFQTFDFLFLLFGCVWFLNSFKQY